MDVRQRCADVLCIPWPCVCVVMFREVPLTVPRVPPSVLRIHRLSETKRYVPADLQSNAENLQHESMRMRKPLEIEPRQRLLLWAAGIMCLVAAKRAAYGSGSLLHW